MMNRIALAGLCVLFAAATRLPAQGNTAEVFGGYQYSKFNPVTPLPKESMHGWYGGATGYLTRHIGASVEIGGIFGDAAAPSSVGGGTALNMKTYSYLAGPVARIVDTKKAQFGVKFLLGGAFGQANLPANLPADKVQALANAGYSSFNQTKFAMLVGFPVDLAVSKLVAFRVEPGIFISDFNKSMESNFRLSVGPVFRFGGK